MGSKECKGTLIETLFKNSKTYFKVYKPHRDKIKLLKDKVRAKYSDLVKNAEEDSDFGKIKALKRESHEKVMELDAPCLERYYLSRPFCTKNNKVNHIHL